MTPLRTLAEENPEAIPAGMRYLDRYEEDPEPDAPPPPGWWDYPRRNRIRWALLLLASPLALLVWLVILALDQVFDTPRRWYRSFNRAFDVSFPSTVGMAPYMHYAYKPKDKP